MKRFLILFSALWLLAAGEIRLAGQPAVEISVPALRAWNHPDIVSAERIDPGQFDEKWVLLFRQPIDHGDPAAGEFSQRVIVGARATDPNRPVVFVTEGYGAEYALRPSYMDELARELEAHVVVVEHRYFGPSTPAPRDWNHLSVENAMHDLHRINGVLRTFFAGPWIATGISKGGMTTMMYNAWYPDDAAVWVPYVAPLNRGLEDGRHEPFIENACGTPGERARILAFQRQALARRGEIQPLFEALCRERGLTFRVPIEAVYDYCVLEYSFAFWQWGSAVDRIPAAGSPPGAMLDHLVRIAGPDYFAVDDEPSFYVQAARELGYYGYDVRPFRGLLSIGTAKGYLYRVMLPDDARVFRYSRRVSRRTARNLRRNDPRMIFIYGEYDPWSAAAVDPRWFEGKENMLLMIDAGGNHRARVGTLSETQQVEVWRRIRLWLNEIP